MSTVTQRPSSLKNYERLVIIMASVDFRESELIIVTKFYVVKEVQSLNEMLILMMFYVIAVNLVENWSLWNLRWKQSIAILFQ